MTQGKARALLREDHKKASKLLLDIKAHMKQIERGDFTDIEISMPALQIFRGDMRKALQNCMDVKKNLERAQKAIYD